MVVLLREEEGCVFILVYFVHIAVVFHQQLRRLQLAFSGSIEQGGLLDQISVVGIGFIFEQLADDFDPPVPGGVKKRSLLVVVCFIHVCSLFQVEVEELFPP